MKPVAIDLCCGLGGWTAGLLSEGWDVIGFDIKRHEYGDKRYPAQLILKSILELNGYDLRAVNPSLVVASPPCQEYSYMAMPWSRAKQIAGGLRGEVPFPEGYDGSLTVAELTALFDACFRIAREIGCPIVLENVKGAQPWVGRANANFGSYYLWGDVGNVGGRVVRSDRVPQFGEYVRPSVAQKFNPDGTAHGRGSWFAIADSKERGCSKGFVTGLGKGHDWRQDSSARFNSKSDSRKAASAMIAEIPFPLAQHIAKVFYPR